MDLQPNKTDAIVKPITNTRIAASEWNQLVGSCMAFINAAGFTPDAQDNSQFLNAFIQIAQNLGAIGANVDLSNLSATGEAHFADPNFSNITATAKAKFITYPDLSSGVAITSGYETTSNGWIYINRNFQQTGNQADGSPRLYFDNVQVGAIGASARDGRDGYFVAAWLTPVKTGVTVTAVNFDDLIFYPNL